MRRVERLLLAAAAASLATVFAASTAAEARPRKAHAARGLTVHRRPFTDAGNVVPVGTESRYVYDNQYPIEPMRTGPSFHYGSETLPGRFYLPGSGGLFNF